MDRYDHAREAAEARLDRLDDDGGVAETGADVVEPDEYGVHVDEPDGDLLTDDLEGGLRDDGEADLIDAAADAFNARDLEGLLELVAADGEVPGLLGYEVANLPDALEDLWRRRPTCCLTRGHVDGRHVGVLWDTDGATWWRLALVHVDDVADGRAGVLELSDDAELLERVTAEAPELSDLPEGSRWSEWDEGADGP